MVVLGAVVALVLGRVQGVNPVLWVDSEGRILVQGRPAQARLTKGAKPTKTPFGIGLDLDGTHGGLLLPDYPALALTDSMTVSVWVYLRAYVPSGPGAQILFRGDDRNGLDPYDLVVHSDGTVAFAINDAKNGGDEVSAHVGLKHWVHITASFDAPLSEAKLWLDGVCTKTVQTLHQPLMALSKSYAPGIGIGNVQNDKGPHNQPLNGMIADLRLYDTVLKPAQAGWAPFVEKVER